jgi:VanZ family protein
MMRLRAGLLWVAAAIFVAYLSFVPFHFRALAFDEALAQFARTPYLNLGAGNRADWVANILMFLPLGWFAAAAFVPVPQGRRAFWAIVPATAIGAGWAVAVEFAQLYFPNRTVSINDIVAEVIGAFVGATLWCAFGASSLDWWRRLLRGGPATANAALAAYLLAYLVLSLSPFDFVIGLDELADKAASPLYGAWLAPVGCGRTPCSLKLLVEALAVLPLGWWLAARRVDGRSTVATAAILGAGLGVFIEAAQFLLVSGTSQGASIAARALGVAAGAGLHSMRERIAGSDWARWGRPLVLAGAVPWLAAVAYVAGWIGGRWVGIDAGLARLADVQWMPFYYQYYSTEQALIRSTLVHLFLYAPVGVAAWLWGRRSRSVSAAAAALAALAVAAVAETGKLFVAGKHPDYTDLLFAAASAWATATVLRRVSDRSGRPATSNADPAPAWPQAARSRAAAMAASGADLAPAVVQTGRSQTGAIAAGADPAPAVPPSAPSPAAMFMTGADPAAASRQARRSQTRAALAAGIDPAGSAWPHPERSQTAAVTMTGADPAAASRQAGRSPVAAALAAGAGPGPALPQSAPSQAMAAMMSGADPGAALQPAARSSAAAAMVPSAGSAPRIGRLGIDFGASGQGLSRSRWRQLAGVALLLVVVVSLLRFPLWQLPLAIGLAVYGVALARWPLAYLLVLPMALPLLDLAAYSGRFFWDEFDLLLATTLGVRLLLDPGAAGQGPRLPTAALALVGLSVAVSAAIALWPPAPIDGNAFTNYLSPYNALRVGKGYLWGACLLALIWRDAAAGRDAAGRLQLGLGLALLSAVLGVFWERLRFVGLTDFDAWFRAAGLVSATHIGGAYLEAVLVTLAPFALALALASRRPGVGLFWYGMVAVGAVALLMTLSRAAVAAWAVALAAFALLTWIGLRQPAGPAGAGWGRARGVAAALTVLVGAGSLMAQSDALRGRLAASASDFGVRLAHWRATLDLMDAAPLRRVFGMGLGSFPREFYLAHATSLRLPAYRIEREPDGGQHFVALAGGAGMYLDQRVAPAPGRSLRLRGTVRSAQDGAELAVGLCEKSFLASVRCDWALVAPGERWSAFEVTLTLPPANPSGWGSPPPWSVTLHNGRFGTRVDVGGLSLTDAEGSTERLANGVFDAGLDRWLMHSDAHLAWRAKSTPLHVLFEQGLFGVLAWGALGVAVLARAWRATRRLPAAAAAAALGFALVGAFDTLLDSPRLIVLTAFVLWLLLEPVDGPRDVRGRGSVGTRGHPG